MSAAAPVHAWIQAARLRTLPLALASIAMGNFLAAHQGHFSFSICVLTVLTTVGLQVLSNFSNDYGDSIHGADHKDRIGPLRMVQTGAIDSNQMKMAMWITGTITFVLGFILVQQALGLGTPLFFIFMILGVLAIWASVRYTSGAKPYGYQGWGDFFVVVFFGLVAVLGSYFLQVKGWQSLNLLPALSCGAFATAVLNINNIRDIESDRVAGKFSIPVRIGRQNAVYYHWFLLILGLVLAVIFTLVNYQNPWQWLFLISVVPLVRNGQAVASTNSNELDPYLKQMALSTLLFVFTFGCGLVLSL